MVIPLVQKRTPMVADGRRTAQPPTKEWISGSVQLQGSYIKAFESAYSAFKALPNMPVYQQDLAHYNVLIGQANKPIMNIYVVSFH
jgi:hypothetical protein